MNLQRQWAGSEKARDHILHITWACNAGGLVAPLGPLVGLPYVCDGYRCGFQCQVA